MPTLFNRIYAHSKTAQVPVLTLSERGILGKKVVTRFLKIKKKNNFKNYTRVKSNERDFTGGVINYPVEFRDEIDKLIKAHYKSLQPKKPAHSLINAK